MKGGLETQAEKLAARRYFVVITHDETTQGEPILLLSHPELPGCLAQGDTWEEAENNLADVRKDYILSLLEDGLPVPAPSLTETTSYPSTTMNLHINVFSTTIASIGIHTTEQSDLIGGASTDDYVPFGESLTAA